MHKAIKKQQRVIGEDPTAHNIWNPKLWLAVTVKVNNLDLHAFFQHFYIALALEIKIDKQPSE